MSQQEALMLQQVELMSQQEPPYVATRAPYVATRVPYVATRAPYVATRASYVAPRAPYVETVSTLDVKLHVFEDGRAANHQTVGEMHLQVGDHGVCEVGRSRIAANVGCPRFSIIDDSKDGAFYPVGEAWEP
mmetsp:Transcript_25266/g.43630  ORF Transcript_25266/g.43630 Transcript_25266/m.43630 type:complete len:132 (-) Transcript_25266:1041-1436(-)